MGKIYNIRFSNRWLLLFSITLSGPLLHAQDKIMHLKPPKQAISTGFSQAIVLDHRADTTNMGLTNLLYPIRFDTITSLYIKRYINSTLTIHPHERRTVLINLKKLKYKRDLPQKQIFLSTDIYLQKNDSLWIRIATIDKMYKFRMPAADAMAGLLKALIDTIDLRLGAFRPGTGLFNDSPSFSLRQINDSSFTARSGYPILNPGRSSSPGPGYYPDFKKFRADSIIACSYHLEYQKDSVYHLIYTPLTGKIADTLLSKIWVYTDEKDSMYIHLTKDIFLPLTQKDNTFCFYIPHSLPDMHSIQMIDVRKKSLDWGPIGTGDISFPSGGSGGTGNLLIIPIAIATFLIVDLTLHTTATVVINSQIKKIKASGRKFEKFRDCFIDMDNGNIVYY
jgi:hypothetical protein